MTKELELHQIQVQILKVLLFEPEARFRDMNIDKVSTDHFTFHLKQLIRDGLIDKTDEGKYKLTFIGKEFANRYDTENLVIEKQAKLGVLVIAFKKIDGVKKILFQRRLKNPFFGYLGFVSGKIRWGEKILETAARELEEETGLKAKLKFAGIEHKTDYSKKGEILEDKFFYVIKATEIKGKLMESFEGGENIWLKEKEILLQEKVFEDIPKILKGLKTGKFFFLEDVYEYSKKRY